MSIVRFDHFDISATASGTVSDGHIGDCSPDGEETTEIHLSEITGIF